MYASYTSRFRPICGAFLLLTLALVLPAARLQARTTTAKVRAASLTGTAPRLEAVPNPASGTTRLTGLRPGEPVMLLNPLGYPVRQFFPRTTPAELDLHDLTPGLYLLQAGRRVARLVVE